MRKLKLLFAACAFLAGGMTASAQTDVTSTYITNADFSQGTPITVGVCTYAKDAVSNGTTYSQLVPVEGWEIPANGDARAGGLIAFGSGVWIGGPGYTAPATNSDGDATGNILGLVGVWSGTAQYTQNATLPAGKYTLVLGVYNSVGGTDAFTKNLIGFIEDGGTEHLAATKVYSVNTWKYEFITFELATETSGKFTLGQHLFLSGIQLFDGEVDATAYEAAKALKRKKGEWTVALQNANDALTNYTYVVGDERSTLETEVGKAEPTTIEGYEEAISALTNALSAFNGAKVSFDALETAKAAATPDLAYAATAKKTALTDAKGVTATSKTDAEEKTAAIITALRAYYESHALAEGVEGALNMTDRIANPNADDGNNSWTWSGNKNNPASNEPWTDADGNATHKYFDGGNWNGSNWTTTMKQTISIPAGKYLLTAKGRAATNTTLTMAVGEASVELPHVGSTGNVFDRGWGDASVEFTTDGSDVDIEVEAKADPTHEWFSVSDFRLVRLELYTEMATSTDYEAMADALADAKAKTLGFEKGEYAPYANVEAIQAIAVAEAVDTDAENAKSDIEAITTALGNWIANATDVDAIYNGTFAEANGTNPKGWTRSNNGWGQQITGLSAEANGVAEGTTTAWYYNTNGSWQYGNDGIYVMPLAANQAYVLTFKYRKHNTDWQNWMKASVLKDDAGLALTEFSAAEDGTTFVTAKAYFTTGAAGNYILSIEQNGNAHLTDVSLVKAESAAIALNEGETFSPINRTYYETVNMTRTVKDGFNTVCLPFDLTAEQVADAFGENAKVYTYSETSEESNNVTINFNAKEGNTIAANVPVLIGEATASKAAVFNSMMFKSGETNVAGNFVTFKGIYAPITVAEGDYFIGNGALCKSEGATSLKAFRAYLDATDEVSVKMFVGDEEIATGIDTIENGQLTIDNAPIYNLAGQRLQKMQKGINIVNGKKILK